MRCPPELEDMLRSSFTSRLNRLQIKLSMYIDGKMCRIFRRENEKMMENRSFRLVSFASWSSGVENFLFDFKHSNVKLFVGNLFLCIFF